MSILGFGPDCREEIAGDLHACSFVSLILIAGNSVGGNMSAALALMAKDKKGPKIAPQVLFIPATDASVNTESYQEFGTGRFWRAIL